MDLLDDVKVMAGSHLEQYDGVYRPSYCYERIFLDEVKQLCLGVDDICNSYMSFLDRMKNLSKKQDGRHKVVAELRADLSDKFDFCFENIQKKRNLYYERSAILDHMKSYLEDKLYPDRNTFGFLEVDAETVTDVANGNEPEEQLFFEKYGVGFGDDKDDIDVSILLTFYRYRAYSDSFEHFGTVAEWKPQKVFVEFESKEDSVSLEVNEITGSDSTSGSLSFDNEVEREVLEDELDEAVRYLENIKM